MKSSPCEPVPLDVVARHGTPEAVRVRSRRLLRVRAVIDLWRIEDEWWRSPVSRAYYLLELENGVHLTVFQDLITGQWYRQNWKP
jgi:hypothetical protein